VQAHIGRGAASVCAESQAVAETASRVPVLAGEAPLEPPGWHTIDLQVHGVIRSR
jgi:hypothetical protein